ncbi:GntR family transcriptional regulator [uncultured Martelella sp.]|uniref:GntR family transcriptional regulator n=1 Tax=uncultured Martelella sp. TaxID=392331 RepID=UPI0029C6536A|nr:GntR family transcriptional regulator [uncultured Martelella sp.]
MKINRPRSLTLLVVDRIREMIVEDEIELGALISENDLAARLGVSRSPIREALQRLEIERLVQIFPQRGTFVFQFEEKQLEQTFEMRDILESGALQICIRHDRDLIVERLDESLEKGAVALRQSAAEFRKADAGFHSTIVETCGNRDLIDAYVRISGRVRSLLNRLARTDAELQGSQNDHAAIVDHIRAGRDADAVQALSWHMNGLPRMYAEKFKQT